LLKLHYRLIIQNFELLKTIFYEIQFHKELREAFYKNVVSRVLSILEKNIAEQKIRTDVDPQLAAQTLLGIFIGIIMVRTMVEEHEGRQDEDKIISNILDILFNGIKKRD
jgi:hypothetical protein